jgi:hypothetical protein
MSGVFHFSLLHLELRRKCFIFKYYLLDIVNRFLPFYQGMSFSHYQNKQKLF